MKQFIAFTLLSLMVTVSLAQDNLTFPIQQGTVSDWKYVSDRVMGGVSEGNVYLEQDGDTSFARLIGDVSTRNNGDSFSYVLLSLYLKSQRCFS